MRNTRGGQEVGGPHGASRKQAMTYVCHGLFPLIFCASNKLIQPVSLKQQVATKKKMVTATTADDNHNGTTTTMTYPMPTVQPNNE